MADIYGQLVKAQVENLGSDPGGTPPTGQVWFNTGTNLLKWYDSAAIRVAVSRDATESLSNKTLVSASVSTSLTFLAQAEARFADSDSSNYVGFKSPATVAANKIWTLPDADGSIGQFLKTDGSLVLSWASALSDPMTTRGDIIVRNAANATARLAIGTAGKVLTTDGTDVAWTTPAAATSSTAGTVPSYVSGLNGVLITGITTSITADLRYTRTGTMIVALMFFDAQATKNGSGAVTIVGLFPTGVRPLETVTTTILIAKNGTYAPCFCNIDSGGTVSISADAAGNNFSNGDTINIGNAVPICFSIGT